MDLEDDVLDTSKLQFTGTFEQQVGAVLDYIHLKRDEVESLNGLITDLHNILSSVWKDIRIFAFGSIVTGLGIRTSDVDCFVQLPKWMYPPDKSFVLKARAVLMRHPHLFQHLFAITHAKVPIVQCYHVPTQVYCDISFNSPAGVANSNLIAYLLKLDKKALNLAILVKYWSKIHNLAGTNLMSSYCLTLLVVFFLQQTNMFPSVAHLQENAEEYNIDEWNSAFSTSEYTNRDSSSSLYELLGEFFKYYSSFEFDKYIVSPYLGKPVSRELFAKLETVPSNFSQYINNVGSKNVPPIRLDSVMCVQDSFQHNRNCAVAVYPRLVKKFLAQIQEAVSIYESESESNFLKLLLQQSTSENIGTTTTVDTTAGKERKNRPPLDGVKKNYRRNRNLKKENYRQNYSRGRNQEQNYRQNYSRGRNQEQNYRQNYSRGRNQGQNYRQDYSRGRNQLQNYRQDYSRGRNLGQGHWR